ncbi:NUDIX hydrolase [Saliterribacillus persicus]|uniref:ADP-ribose pyrophosphatase n=1 Tax=Saliterribacillus persicus TaxID=930114 RepID=A0A368XEF9_9BACI|nr:NUDIX hydrolase [Saliterribacillus persicus]RCW64847.1 ADP-ribose pyrophosphatase [Saliterribacillus persicus]
MNSLEEKTITIKNIYKGRIIELNIEEVLLPNGKNSQREIIKHPGAVAIIALTDQNKIVLVKQYRKALEKNIVEIPAGKLEKGEKPVITAIRELEEETGYTTDHLKYLTSFYTSPGFANELVYLYYTDQLYSLENKKELDEDEFVELLELSLEDTEKLINDQVIHDAKTMYALLYLKLKRLEKNENQ